MEQNVINEEHYKLRVRKNWVKATEQWHIQIVSDTVDKHTFEMFLTDFELQKFKDAL